MDPTFLIDAGHPPRGCDVGGMPESEWTLAFANRLAMDLERWPAAVHQTRYDDKPIGLTRRASIGRIVGADLVVSLHVNTNPDPRVCGLMTFHTTREARLIGDRIMQAYRRPGVYISGGVPITRPRMSTRARPNHWTSRAYNALRRYDAPALLIECLFATNADDLAVLHSEGGKHELLAAIECGLAYYLRIKEIEG